MAKTKKIERAEAHFNEIMQQAQDVTMSRLNCHNIGRILEFDPATQTCTVELMQVKQYMDNYYNPAPITDVPLIIYGAGGGHITLPDPVGTYCLLFFMDRNIDSFLETGEQYVPETTRMHDFTDCIAITTFKTLVNPISNYDKNAVTITYQNSNIKVKDEIEGISQGDTTLTSPTRVVLNSPEVETTGNLNVATGFTGIIPSGAATIQVTNGIITGVG